MDETSYKRINRAMVTKFPIVWLMYIAKMLIYNKKEPLIIL